MLSATPPQQLCTALASTNLLLYHHLTDTFAWPTEWHSSVNVTRQLKSQLPLKRLTAISDTKNYTADEKENLNPLPYPGYISSNEHVVLNVTFI